MRPIFLLLFVLLPFLGSAQHQDGVDFIRGEVMIRVMPQSKEIGGHVSYTLNSLDNVDSVFLDAKNMNFTSVEIDSKKVKYTNTGKIISIYKKFKKGKTYNLFLEYSVKPKQTVYYLGLNDTIVGNEQIWTQGQGKYTSHWLPSFNAMEEKVEFDLAIVVDERLEVISNGQLIGNRESLENTRMWSFDMQEPMSSYLLAFAIGNYEQQKLTSASGIPIENYYYPKDSLKVEPTYRHTKKIFDFLEEEIGFPYPWQNYKQIPVRDFLYAGMENTTATIFSDGYVIDSTAFVDKNYVNVNAHELAHQWFGNLVTEKNGNHHWLHEGFATYYAHLAEKEIFGEDHYYWKLYESLQQLKSQTDKGEGQSLLDPKASSLTFYEKGAWALFILRNEIGDRAFKQGIKHYLEKFKFKNATVDEFITVMEMTSKKDLSDFRKEWLENVAFPFEKAKRQLAEQSPSIKLLVDMETELEASQSDDIEYVAYWDATNSIHLRKHLLQNYWASLPKEIYERAFSSDTVPIRQALFSVSDLPKLLGREKLISLLQDDSYVTQENALFTLWQAYPEDRAKYLDATKSVVGLPNKNVRLLWLTLAMLSDNYKGSQTKIYFDELSSYTSPEYGFETRQGAFFYLKEAFGLNEESLKNLVGATNHHSWQFKKFARNLVDELLADADYRARFEMLAKELNEEETPYLNTKLNEE